MVPRGPAGADAPPSTTRGKPGVAGRRLASILDETKLRRVLAKMLDENEFLSEFGIRSLSRYHAEHPYVIRRGRPGVPRRAICRPNPTRGMFGGNSNWRGPIWMPVNAPDHPGAAAVLHLLRRRLHRRMPDRLGQQMNLYQVAEEIARRLANIFLQGRGRPAAGLRRHREVPGRSALARSASCSTSTSTATTAPASAPAIRPAGPGSSPALMHLFATHDARAGPRAWQAGHDRRRGESHARLMSRRNLAEHASNARRACRITTHSNQKTSLSARGLDAFCRLAAS